MAKKVAKFYDRILAVVATVGLVILVAALAIVVDAVVAAALGVGSLGRNLKSLR